MANVGVVCRAAHVNEALKAGLTGQHAVTFFDGTAKPRLHEMLGPSEVVICSGLGLPPNFIDGEAMDAAPSLRLIQQFGVGKEVMDVEAAHRRGIWVATLPQANSVAVAEIGLFLIFGLAKQATMTWRALCERSIATPLCDEVFGKRYCVVGLGNVGMALAVRLRALGGDVVAVDYPSRTGAAKSASVSRLYPPEDLHAALRGSDYVVLCVPWTEATHDLIGEAEIRAMGPAARLINIARGGIVRREALEAALFSGALSGYGTDVGWDEPINMDEPLWQRDNVVVTPHIGATTRETIDLNLRLVTANVRRVEDGLEPLFLVSDSG